MYSIKNWNSRMKKTRFDNMAETQCNKCANRMWNRIKITADLKSWSSDAPVNWGLASSRRTWTEVFMSNTNANARVWRWLRKATKKYRKGLEIYWPEMLKGLLRYSKVERLWNLDVVQMKGTSPIDQWMTTNAMSSAISKTHLSEPKLELQLENVQALLKE